MDIAYLDSQTKFQIIDWDRFNSALIIEIKRGDIPFTSTAVAIGRNMLLTAAHSVDQYESGCVRIGESYRGSKKSVKIKQCVIHPGYNPSKSFYENDIAIIILENNLPDNIRIERMSEDVEMTNGDVLDRIGFGMRENKNIRTWSNPTYMMNTFNHKNFVLEDNLSVVGDSGGPVYKNENGVLKLVGIHSTLEGSNKTYVVNVSQYVDWIEQNKSLKGLS